VIVESANDYCIQVKGNQASLFARLQSRAMEDKPIDVEQSREKNRGRLEHRQVKLFEAPTGWQPEYAGVSCFVALRRWGLREGKYYNKTHYYILSRPMQDARQAGQLIRDYWSIENRLHYVKDVTMKEDTNGIAHKQGAKNISLLKNIALNLIRQRGYKCIKTAIHFHAHDIKRLYQWLL
jgi:predicted transposase YbfD/YdcC